MPDPAVFVLTPSFSRMKFICVLFGFFLPLLSSTVFAQSEFSQANAEALLKALVLEIGPRPMGSPAEQRALAFAAQILRAYGCDTSYVLPMTVAEGVNTKSGVAVGVKKGKTGRIIIIGGHIDSAGPEIPGANDDGSGTACVLELARVLCARDNASTVMFCCWGGEEQGLRGSTHFLETFPQLDSVVLMVQLDMADGSSFLMADPDGTRRSAPAWLLEAAFDISRNELGRNDLVYQTGMATWNVALGGVYGSDHIPFIDKGIPAIGFISDVNYPIHTPQDSWDNFTPSGMKRSGDLVLKLFERFDNGVPSRTTERYQVIEMKGWLLIIPYALLWTVIALALMVGVATFMIMRRRRIAPDPATRVKWSGFKLFLATGFTQLCVWNGETVLGAVRGLRFPWVHHTDGYVLFGMLSGLIGVWVVLQAVRRYRLSSDAWVFARVAIVVLVVFTVLAALRTPELSISPALALLCLSAALWMRQPVLKVIAFACASFILYKLVFFDGLTFIQRGFSMNTISGTLPQLLYEAVFVLVFTLLSLPLVYGFAAAYRSSGIDLLWLKRFRTPKGLLVAGTAWVAVAAYLTTQPAYGRYWYNVVRVEQRMTLGGDDSIHNTLELRGSESLRGLHAVWEGKDSLLHLSSNYLRLALPQPVNSAWAEIASQDSSSALASDSLLEASRTIVVRSAKRPLQMEAVFESTQPFDVRSPWAHGAASPNPMERETDRRKRFVWFSYPAELLHIPLTCTMRPSQKIAQRVTVTFDSLSYPLRLQREWTNVFYRTVVVAQDTLAPSGAVFGARP
ncbi:MAG: hypothetical protein C4326_02160 [Ignavibacteria bacterium]